MDFRVYKEFWGDDDMIGRKLDSTMLVRTTNADTALRIYIDAVDASDPADDLTVVTFYRNGERTNAFPKKVDVEDCPF